MKNMNKFLSNWNFWRIARLAIGVLLLYEASADHEVLLYIMGSFLTMHALLNIGCGTGQCINDNCEIPEKKVEK